MLNKSSKKSDYSKYVVTRFPVRHKKKIPFNPIITINSEIRSMINEIKLLDSELGKYLLSGQDYYDLVLDAYSSNIHWSTKIEGNRMTLEEVKSLATEFTTGRIKESPNGPNQEILNHLGFLFNDELKLPWDIDTALYVHRYLMRDVSSVKPGVLRKEDVCVRGSDGIEYFIACPTSSVQEELTSLMEWADMSPYDSIITATLFFHEFESIHPFPDGNGRTGRVLFQALLSQLGLNNCNLCKFEEKMLSDPITYYNLMSYTDLLENYTPLIKYVVESLLDAYREAIESFSEKNILKDMDENTRHIVLKAKKSGPFTLRDATGWINLGELKIKKTLDDLVDAGVLTKEGRTRSLRYEFMDPFKDFKRRITEEDHL